VSPAAELNQRLLTTLAVYHRQQKAEGTVAVLAWLLALLLEV
jgi:hypothetical protein